MQAAATLAVLAIAGLASGAAMAANGTHEEATSSGNCDIVHLKPGEQVPSGNGMSTSITAGNGQVSGQTTTGNGVTVHSGSGTTGSSVATSTTSNGRTTTVTSSDGHCTVYIQPEK